MNHQSHILTACLMECTAPKPGNVSPIASFDDLTYRDFQRTAPITAAGIAAASRLGVGQSVLQTAQEISRQVGRNTHLGILLLLAPLVAAETRQNLATTLDDLTVEDAKSVYEAIRIMEPGGIGEVESQDVQHEPTDTLLECMRLAENHDTIARQYTNGFEDIFRFVDSLKPSAFQDDWKTHVIHLQLQMMSQIPDTLIARKCGETIASEATSRAQSVLNQNQSEEALQDFDRWLRADGNRRNPGTTADMVAAILYIALRENIIAAPHELTNSVD
ncbi:MAG: triphosphoribosyl-dephospho-CoA synthase [Planctomycetaceae bacterium]